MATHCTGKSTVAMAARTGCVMRKRASATIRNSASALQTISLESADGPCLKNGGGVRSRVPKGMGAFCPRASLAGEDRTQPFHPLERDAAAADHARQRVFGDQH